MSKESDLKEAKFLKKKGNKIAFITIFGIIQFLILSMIAMLFYPGSHKDDLYSEGYIFSLNKFSDLGAWKTYSGESNLISFIIFNLSMIIVGLSLIPYVVFSAKYFIKKDMSRILVIIGEIFGIIASLGFIGVGLTPRDLLHELHKYSEYAAFLSIFVMSIIYMILIYKDSKYPNKYAIIYAICVVCQFIYLFIVFDIFIVSNQVDAIAQKLIVYIQLVVFLIQAVGILQIDKG